MFDGQKTARGVMVRYRKCETNARSREALHVLHGTEHADLALLIEVGLHALEAAHAVMKYRRGRVNLQGAVRHNLRHSPALITGPLDLACGGEQRLYRITRRETGARRSVDE